MIYISTISIYSAPLCRFMPDSPLLLQKDKEFVVDEASSATITAKRLQISKKSGSECLVFKVVEWRTRGHGDPDI